MLFSFVLNFGIIYFCYFPNCVSILQLQEKFQAHAIIPLPSKCFAHFYLGYRHFTKIVLNNNNMGKYYSLVFIKLNDHRT